jgi:ADP-ribose pyrophosphatase YjhB (NUDIX family)
MLARTAARRFASSLGSFVGKRDRFQGVTVSTEELLQVRDSNEFSIRLKKSLQLWRDEGARCCWLKVPALKGEFVTELSKSGFALHHADEHGIMLNKWLSSDTSEVNKMPSYATHFVGVGAVVINSQDEILLIREKYDVGGVGEERWKIPGGLVDRGEGLDEGAIREVFEETGVKTRFVSLLGVREKHGYQFGCDDCYFVVRLAPLSSDIEKEVQEIADAAWKPLSFYFGLKNGIATQKAIATVLQESNNDPSVTDWERQMLLPGSGNNPTAPGMKFYHWSSSRSRH